MKKSIIIAALFLTLSLGGCGGDKTALEREQDNVGAKSPYSDDLLNAIKVAKESEESTELTLSLVSADAENAEVALILKNPKNLAVSSVRSFLTYNPALLQGEEIILPTFLQGEDVLFAPTEKEFDNEEGLMRFGFSAPAAVLSGAEVELARIKFKRKQSGVATIDFFDARTDGHTTVLSSFNGRLRDTLALPASPALILETTETLSTEDEKNL